MFLRLLLILTITPIIELWLLGLVSERIGLSGTILMILGTGALGAALAKHQGLDTWREIRRQMSQGQVPAGMLLDGVMIFVAALLLITPGVLTDLLGVALLVPPIRRKALILIIAALKAHVTVRVQTFAQGFPGGPIPPQQPPPPDAIDVEFERQPPEQPPAISGS